MDINDKLSAQGNEVTLKFELWHEGPKDYNGKKLWDTRLLRESYDYSIGSSGHSSGTETLEEGDHYLKFEITTLGIERANTVAVHENGTVFNGHYAAQVKVSVVKFSLSDNGDGTPFVSGDNVIVTPISLFTSTLLNAKLQH